MMLLSGDRSVSAIMPPLRRAPYSDRGVAFCPTKRFAVKESSSGVGPRAPFASICGDWPCWRAWRARKRSSMQQKPNLLRLQDTPLDDVPVFGTRVESCPYELRLSAYALVRNAG